MKKFLMAVMAVFCAGIMFAQSDDELFGGDDDFFFGDDDGIIEMEAVAAPKTDLAKGVLFETGSVKIGGNFELSLTSLTAFSEGKSFADSLKETSLSPVADAQITLDARPSENLRMFMKTGISYPYVTKNNASLMGYSNPMTPGYSLLITSDDSLRNLFYIKELFSDFNLGENVAFRFGKQTVTWGVGYFFSPADVINSAIDPENPTAQVEGPLCLRTQIVFPGTQNALWAYLIPDSDLIYGSAEARDTALAAKAEFVLGGWELGLGGYYKYDTTPRACLTASGTLFNKLSVFTEAVAAYGQTEEWLESKDKTFFGQATVGFMYNWKTPKIILLGQYFYNGQKDYEIEKMQQMLGAVPEYAAQTKELDFMKREGHNAALAVNFGKVFTNSLSASVYAVANFTIESTIASAMLTYSPVNEIKVSFGPYLTWLKYDETPVTAAKITFTLGGGKF